MERPAQLTAKIESLSEFREIVRAMRAIAASHIQEAQGTLTSIRQYTEQIEHAIVEAAALAPPDLRGGPRPQGEDAAVIVAICSEHGLSGAYSAHILDRTETFLGTGAALGVVGRKGRLLAEERALAMAWCAPMAAHARSIAALCIELMYSLAPYSRVRVVYAEYETGGQFAVRDKLIAPLDPGLFEDITATRAPLHYLAPPALLASLSLEYIYAELMRAVTEAFASENGARLAIMQAADKNTDDKLTVLERQEKVMRQEEVTAELLDIVSGAEAARRQRNAAQR